jgi:S-adenosylmethionine:tRNA ribosyltransferase-isomerase
MLLPVRTSDFEYSLPEELIAQEPLAQRDESRLMVIDRAKGTLAHRHFRDLPDFLRLGDLLVFNNSKVIPARLRARDPETGGKFEILLLRACSANDWWTMMRPGKRAPVGKRIELLNPSGQPTGTFAEVTHVNAEGHRRLRLGSGDDFAFIAESWGEMPLPPYIHRTAGASSSEDKARYQTVYAGPVGSVAAPTAGLHFTPDLLERLRSRSIETHFVTLHVGLGTFAPIKADHVEDHHMHEERFTVPPETADAIARAKADQRRIVSVGTTSLRVLESVARDNAGNIVAGSGATSIFLRPPARFSIVDGLITNFHLPRSTLLMLTSAFAAPDQAETGRALILRAYAEAVRERYRFFSYGDAMFLT